MQKRTREIVAVLLLGVLLLVGAGAMGYYIFIGHNWNVAASHIDDSIGQMDGYTVLLYAGTRQSDNDGEAQVGEVQDGESEEPPAKLAELLDEQEADLNSVVESYRDKGANVFVLDAGDLSRYSEPFVVAKRGMRMGLFAVGKTTLRSAARADVHYLTEHNTDYTVGITDDPTLGDVAAEGLIGDPSVLVLDDPKGRYARGEYRGSTYCVSTPLAGDVGVLIISPSGVLSSKVIGGDQES